MCNNLAASARFERFFRARANGAGAEVPEGANFLRAMTQPLDPAIFDEVSAGQFFCTSALHISSFVARLM